jgi:hypothetical protein
VTQQLGYQGQDGIAGYLCGRDLITINTRANMDNEEPSDATITFRGADVGDEQLVDGFRRHGTFDGWQIAMALLAPFGRLRLAIYAALCPPLLAVLQSLNFIFSFAGATSQGKTTALRAAASCWGSPDERSRGAAVGTWDATRTWIERAATVLNDLPLLMDDTKRAQRSRDVASVIYDVAAGRSRGRGSVEGLRETGTFRTVMLSTGEAPITSFTQDGGTRSRSLELWGPPFGDTSPETAQLVNLINDGVLEHYGHAGPQFVGWLLRRRDRWPGWREHHRRLRRRYERRAGDNSVAARMADHFAALRVTAILAHRAGILPWPYKDVVSELWPVLTADSPEADRAAAALRLALSWAVSHEDEFESRRHDSNPPHCGWAGRWDRDVHNTRWAFLGFLPHVLDKVLEDGGFEPEPIKRLWFDRGWLRVNPGRRQYKARIGCGSEWLIAIARAAVDAIELPEVQPD